MKRDSNVVRRRRDGDHLQCLSVSSFKIGVVVPRAGRCAGPSLSVLCAHNTCFHQRPVAVSRAFDLRLEANALGSGWVGGRICWGRRQERDTLGMILVWLFHRSLQLVHRSLFIVQSFGRFGDSTTATLEVARPNPRRLRRQPAARIVPRQ